MKRALSFILALTLAFALLPTFALAVETTETKVFKFEFGSELMSDEVKEKLVEYGSTGERFYIRRGNTVSGPNWNVITTTNKSVILHKNNNNKLVKIFAKHLIMGFTNDSLASGYDTLYIEVTVPEDGIYDVTAVCRNMDAGANVDVTLDDTWTGKGELYATGTDGDKAGDEIIIPVATRVYLEKGAHTLSFKNWLEEGNYSNTAETFENAVFRAELTLAEPDDVQLITEAFTTETPTAIEYESSVLGVGYNASEGTATVEGIEETLQTSGDYKGSYKMYAPAKNGDAQFLYWAKGLSMNKKIVSYENEFYYTPAGGDNNILIAVYDNVDSVSNKAEFYNANGQLIKLITDKSDDKAVPALPSMAGYNSASSWKQYNGETVATAGNEIKPEGTMIFVAQYESEKPMDVTVTVENGNGTATVPYGEFVTCTPDAENGELKWWKKEVNGVSEIVSIDDTYKFRAWETCTVTAEYADEKPEYIGNKIKIIIDTFTAGNEKAVMAEFIGFGADTVEKGIIYNGTKIAMTKPGNQFTLTGKAKDTFKGYAIVKNGEEFNLIVDGEATISNAE